MHISTSPRVARAERMNGGIWSENATGRSRECLIVPATGGRLPHVQRRDPRELRNSTFFQPTQHGHGDQEPTAHPRYRCAGSRCTSTAEGYLIHPLHCAHLLTRLRTHRVRPRANLRNHGRPYPRMASRDQILHRESSHMGR